MEICEMANLCQPVISSCRCSIVYALGMRQRIVVLRTQNLGNQTRVKC